MEKHELIQVKIELGHKAWCRKQPTLEGFTHEWVMFVRGPDNSDVSHFVEKVVFFLHDSFPRPKRVVKDPPFKLEEKGYGCFHLPVQVHFKNKEEPKKVDFDYDLLLPGLGQPPVSNIRSEALTFKNPTDEFKRKVLRAGGVIISNANGCHSSTTINGSGSHLSSTCKTSKKSLPASNSPTGNRSEKTPAKKVKLDKPIKSKLSSESSSSASASVSSKRPADPDSVVTPVTKKKKSSSESLLKCKSVGFMSDGSVKDKKDDHKESMKQKLKALAGKGNVEKTEKGEKKKEKKISLESSSSTKRRDSTSVKKEKREKLLNSSPMEHKPVKSETKLPTKDGLKSVPVSELKTPKKEEKLAKSTPKISKSVGKLEKKDFTSGESKSHSKLHHKSKHVKKEGKKVEKITIRRNSNESWTSSASSSSSLFSVGTSANANKNNALGTLLAELGDEDDGDEDDEIDVTTYSQSEAIKPTQLLQSNSGKFINSNNSTNNNIVKNSGNGNLSNLQNGKHESSLNKQNKSKSTEKQEADKSHLQKSSHKAKSESEKHSNNSAKGSAKSLLALHKKLVHLKDSSSLQKVVDILETTGSFSITETSLKFDLCTLDAETVRKIENCVNR